MSAPALSGRGLEKRFGPIIALRGVDFEVPRGTALAILGPNGAGKSTLLRIMAGLARPTAGTIEVAGGVSGAGYVGHATLLYGDLSARENLVFAGRLHGLPDPPARADALLAELGLEEFAQRRVGAFSRGMAQRLSIARALVHDPGIVLLDEPFTGLDRSSADRLGSRLRALREASRTLVLVTHDLRQACEIADRAIVVSRGSVVHRCEGSALSLPDLEAAYARVVEGRP